MEDSESNHNKLMNKNKLSKKLHSGHIYCIDCNRSDFCKFKLNRKSHESCGAFRNINIFVHD